MGRGNKHRGTVEGSEFIEWLRDYQFVKKYCAPWYELDVDSRDFFTFLCASWPMFKGVIAT